MQHDYLADELAPIRELFNDVKRKALMRLEYEGLHQSEAILIPGSRFYQDPAGFAMERYAYYVCFKCNKVKNNIFVFLMLAHKHNFLSTCSERAIGVLRRRSAMRSRTRGRRWRTSGGSWWRFVQSSRVGLWWLQRCVARTNVPSTWSWLPGVQMPLLLLGGHLFLLWHHALLQRLPRRLPTCHRNAQTCFAQVSSRLVSIVFLFGALVS